MGGGVQHSDIRAQEDTGGSTGGLIPYEACYSAKPDVAHFRAFGAPCAIVELQARLKKLDERHVPFGAYEYGGGGYRV